MTEIGDDHQNAQDDSQSIRFDIFQAFFDRAFGGFNDDNNNLIAQPLPFTTPEPNRAPTNLQPENRGIAQQRSLFDELERHPSDHGAAVLHGLTRSMKALSVEEQERAMFDLMTENELILKIEDKQTPQQWMEQMDDCMERRKTMHGAALQLAMNTNLEFVKDQRWKFLRAEDWNIVRATERMARFFEHKLELFGSDALCRELTMQDLTAEDVRMWRETGFFQILDERDRSGRPVMVLFGLQQLGLPIETVIRVSFYLTCISANEERAQISGVVQIYWGLGQAFGRPDRATAVLRSWRCLPIRAASKHFCYDSSKLQWMFSLMAQHWNPLQASRFRAHFGTPMECIYNLMTYGISRESMPVTDDGAVLTEYHKSFLEALEAGEKAERLLLALGDTDHIQDEPFLSPGTQADLLQHMWMEMDDEDGDSITPIPMDVEIQNILPEDVIQRLTRSSISTQEPLPMDTSLTDLEGLPKSFLARLARSSFVRSSDTFDGGRSASSPPSKRPSNISPSVTTSSEAALKPQLPGLIVIPGPLDVIMGRGRHNKSKPGNRKLQEKLDEHYVQYEASDKYQKTALAESILNTMMEEGSRFLIRQGDKKQAAWVEVTREKARDKISHDFRNMRGTSTKNKAQVQNDSNSGNGKRPLSTTGSQSQPLKRLFGW
jgi:hypothetical protein